MARIEETQLPGVGVRYDFSARMGRRVGVIAHRSGDRELLVYSQEDPDRADVSVRLHEDESHALAELLGATQVAEAVSALRQSIEGLTIDWMPVREGAAGAGVTIGQTELRKRTGATIVAVVRGEQTHPSPGPEFGLEVGDVAVVIGAPDSIERAVQLLSEG